MSAKHGQTALNIEQLRVYLSKALGDLSDPAQWLGRATQNLRYDYAKPMCKFALFLSAHDTIPDPLSPGLMKAGAQGTRQMMDARIWNSPDFKTIEHVAPAKGQDTWGEDLYENDRYQMIGNLTLLPGDVNSSAGKSPWKVKSVYYRHLAAKDPQKLAGLAAEAVELGIALQPHTLDLLKNSTYSHHMESIVSVPTNGQWDRKLVEGRTERICKLAWNQVAPWLGLQTV